MNIYDFGPIAAALDCAYTALLTISHWIEPIAGASSAAVAVVILTVLVRTLLIPVGVSQMRAERTRRRIAPQVAELQRRYRTSPELLHRKMLELYAAEKASPFAGCLPLLAQAPVLSIVYGLFILTSINGHPNALLSQTLLGVPLGTGLLPSVLEGTVTATSVVPFLVIVVMIAVIAYASRRLLTQPLPTSSGALAAGDQRTRRIATALGFAPFATALAAAFVPLAASIYLLVTVTWTLGERLALRRRFGD